MENTIIDIILKNIPEVLLITAEEVDNGYTNKYCAYVATGEHKYVTLNKKYIVRIREIKTLYQKSFPQDLREWENLFHIIYCKDPNFTLDLNELFLGTIAQAIYVAKNVPRLLPYPERDRLRVILKRYLATNQLNYALSATDKTMTISEPIEHNSQFNDWKKNTNYLFKFKLQIIQLLKQYGGNNDMITLEENNILKTILDIDTGLEPYSPIANEKYVFKAANYIYQMYDIQNPYFDKAVIALGIDKYCSLTDLKNIILLSENFWDAEKGETYFQTVLNNTITGSLCKIATNNLCMEYIVTTGKLAKYKNFVKSTINETTITPNINNKDDINYIGWSFFS